MGALSLTLLLSLVLWWLTTSTYCVPSGESRTPLPRQPTTLHPPWGQLWGQCWGWHRLANHSGLQGVRWPIQQLSIKALPHAHAAARTDFWVRMGLKQLQLWEVQGQARGWGSACHTRQHTSQGLHSSQGQQQHHTQG